MIFGREKEIEEINEYLSTDGSKVLLVYGRKGIGKTVLLKEILKGRPHAYLTAYETTGSEELAILSKEMNSEKPATATELFSKITDMAAGREYTLVLDNFPAFVKADSSFQNELIDVYNKDFAGKNIKLILVSDAFLVLDKLFFKRNSPWKDFLYKALEIKPLDFYESQGFYPEAENSDKAFFYGITGGIPAILNQLTESPKESIRKLFLPGGGNTCLPEDNMEEELREMSNYNRVLMALSNGHTRVNDLSLVTERSKDIVVPYMNTLMDLSIVTKECPVTEKTNRKKTRYSILSTYDYFWYRYFASNMDLYFAEKYDEIEAKIDEDKPDFMKLVYTNIVKTAIMKHKCPGLTFDTDDIGNWWENDEEKKTSEGFDLVAIGKSQGRKALVYGRIYCHETPIDVRQIKSLIALTRKVKEKGDSTYYLAFSSNGFDETAHTAAAAIPNIILVSLDDIA